MKLAGCCSNCDKKIWSVKSQKPIDDPDAGAPTRWAGLADKGAVRVGFVLTNGNLINMSLCGKCADDYDLTKMWKKNCEAWAAEANDGNRSTIVKMVQEVPLGEIHRQLWKDIADARLR